MAVMANWMGPVALNPLTTSSLFGEVWEFPSSPLFPLSSLYSCINPAVES